MQPTSTIAITPPRNSTFVAAGVDRDEADRLARENSPAMVSLAYGGGYEVWRLGR